MAALLPIVYSRAQEDIDAVEVLLASYYVYR